MQSVHQGATKDKRCLDIEFQEAFLGNFGSNTKDAHPNAHETSHVYAGLVGALPATASLLASMEVKVNELPQEKEHLGAYRHLQCLASP